MEENIVVLRDWALFWNPNHDVEVLAGFRLCENSKIFTISPPLISTATPLPGSFFSTESGLVFGWRGKANLDVCYEGMQNYITAIENQLQDIKIDGNDFQFKKEIAFLKDCILLSNLSDYDKEKIIDSAILYPCEDGGYRILDEQSKIMTSNIIAVDLQNNLFLTESGKVYVHNNLLVADLESQEFKVLSALSD